MTLILKKCMQNLICTQNPLECAAFRLSKCLYTNLQKHINAAKPGYT